eukprot:1144406-Pelagomonas_calceolata.AAC.3
MRLMVDCPALQTARRCKCSGVNVAGRMLVDIAAAYGLVHTTGRVHGDVGQPTFFGYRSDNRAHRRSRPDHVLAEHERQLAFVEELEKHLEMLVQLEAALDAGNIDTACFCLRSWMIQAARAHNIGMYRVQGCVFKGTGKQGIRRPV